MKVFKQIYDAVTFVFIISCIALIFHFLFVLWEFGQMNLMKMTGEKTGLSSPSVLGTVKRLLLLRKHINAPISQKLF